MAMRIEGDGSQGEMVSDINVTPFVDVMLVLLIIFMVAAPMMTQGIEVNLPATSSRPIPSDEERLVVSVAEDRQVNINEDAVVLDELSDRLTAAYGGNQSKRGVILRADKRIDYGLVMQVMGAIREAGIDQIGMVTKPLHGGGKNPEWQGQAAQSRVDMKPAAQAQCR